MAFVNEGDIQLAYTDTRVGLLVGLVQGYPFNRSLWIEQVSALSNSFRVITPDLGALGASWASLCLARMRRIVQDVAMLLDTLEIRRAVIGGLLMGGYVELEFYKQFSSGVRAIVLDDTRAKTDTEEGKQTRH